MPPAARKGVDKVTGTPHCHSVHPTSPVPHPVPPHDISTGAMSVKVNGNPLALAGFSMTKICTLPGCVPSGPGLISKGSATVTCEGFPAARQMDTVTYPCPASWWVMVGSTDVIIGG